MNSKENWENGGTTEQTRNTNEPLASWITEFTERSTKRSSVKTNERIEWTNPRNQMNSWMTEWKVRLFAAISVYNVIESIFWYFNANLKAYILPARMGLFDEGGHDFTICPKHRDQLGIKFRASINRKEKWERGINLRMSKEIKRKWNVVVPQCWSR